MENQKANLVEAEVKGIMECNGLNNYQPIMCGLLQVSYTRYREDKKPRAIILPNI